MAWQGPQSTNIPCQDEGGDLSFLEYLARHTSGRLLPSIIWHVDTVSAAPSYLQSRRRSPSPLHPSDTSPSVTPTGPAGRRAEPGSCLTLLPWNGYPSTPLPFDTVPFRHYSPEMSALHHIRPFIMSTLRQVLWRQSAGGELYQGNSIEELFQRAGSLKGYSLKGYSLRMLRSHKLVREPVLEPVLETRTRNPY